MTGQQPHVISAGPRKRHFITSAVAVQAIIINRAEQVLLLNSPTQNQGWQVVSGALEAKETLLGANLREVSEELGSELIIRPLGLVNARLIPLRSFGDKFSGPPSGFLDREPTISLNTKTETFFLATICPEVNFNGGLCPIWNTKIWIYTPQQRFPC